MAYAATGNTSIAFERITNGMRWRTWTVTEAEASSAAEFTITVPKVGIIWLVHWQLTTPGSSTTMRPTFRTATGAWDGSGTGAINDVWRGTAAAQGPESPTARYYAPSGLLYVRTQADNAATDAATEIRITILEGAA